MSSQDSSAAEVAVVLLAGIAFGSVVTAAAGVAWHLRTRGGPSSPPRPTGTPALTTLNAAARAALDQLDAADGNLSAAEAQLNMRQDATDRLLGAWTFYGVALGRLAAADGPSDEMSRLGARRAATHARAVALSDRAAAARLTIR